jgi:hypothetical protein
MSVRSRQRQAVRDAALGRTKSPAHKPKREPYKPAAFSVTDFARQANNANISVSRSELAAKHGRLGAHGNPLLTPEQRKQRRYERMAVQADKIAKATTKQQ